MKEVRLAYGRDGIVARVPDDAVVVTATELPGLPDEAGAVLEALRAPSARAAAGRARRRGAGAAARGPAARGWRWCSPTSPGPCPTGRCSHPCLPSSNDSGAGPDRVELLCATGTHRLATADEMAELVGPEIAGRYTVHQHRADGPAGDHVEVGRVDGTPVGIDRRYVEADVRILTGFVEPHFFAGFSGGPKGACPGLAALETILEAHSPGPDLRPPGHLARDRGQSRPRLRPRRGGSGAADPVGRRGHQPAPPAHRGLRRPAPRRARGGMPVRRGDVGPERGRPVRRRPQHQRRAIPSTATSTRR